MKFTQTYTDLHRQIYIDIYVKHLKHKAKAKNRKNKKKQKNKATHISTLDHPYTYDFLKENQCLLLMLR